jgi:tetratricopeptide (TPR) repeat protein
VHSLQAHCTGDYRFISGLKNSTALERIEYFRARSESVHTEMAWQSIEEREIKRTPDYCRIANASGYSVGTGHNLLELSLPLELRELQSVFVLSKGRKLSEVELVEVLNATPETCFDHGSSSSARVQVIGWGHWATFFQRHICHSLQQNFDFLERKWGVPDQAKEFSSQCEKLFGNLRLYPFVRRFNCTDAAGYHKALDDAFRVTVATPHLVSSEIWNNLCYSVDFAPFYQAVPNPHVNEWHKHNPPPGTAYDPSARTDHPSLVNRPDSVMLLEKLHVMAPYDGAIASFLLRKKYNGNATYAQAEAIYRPCLEFSSSKMVRLARTLKAEPQQYEDLMFKAAKLNPSLYFVLAEHFVGLGVEQKAAECAEKGIELGPDSLNAASVAVWLVPYYLKHEQKQKASDLADLAGEVYSHAGLRAKARFLEQTGKYDDAFEWYSKISERYDVTAEMLSFAYRYRLKTGDNRYERQVADAMQDLFPSGIENAALPDLRGSPVDGVLLKETNQKTVVAGLDRGDVIVSVNGIRTHTVGQYQFAMDVTTDPPIRLIVWRINQYLPLTGSPLGGRFDVNIADYTKDGIPVRARSRSPVRRK